MSGLKFAETDTEHLSQYARKRGAMSLVQRHNGFIAGCAHEFLAMLQAGMKIIIIHQYDAEGYAARKSMILDDLTFSSGSST